ncbi:MAG: hypothetical protein KUG64_10850 [Cycloclasticus sp.]|nr:hypothetical protein [Cycloclasticus sp.]
MSDIIELFEKVIIEVEEEQAEELVAGFITGEVGQVCSPSHLSLSELSEEL